MADQEINIDAPAMVQAGTAMEDAHGGINAQIARLQSEFESLMGTWGGDAASQYHSAMQGYYEDCNTILTSLQRLATNVDEQAKEYQQAHGQTTDQASALMNRISHTQAGLAHF
jgi:WXG100 family type VII secretion target